MAGREPRVEIDNSANGSYQLTHLMVTTTPSVLNRTVLFPKSKFQTIVTDKEGLVHYDSKWSKGVMVYVSPLPNDPRNAGLMLPGASNWPALPLGAGMGACTELDKQHPLVFAVHRLIEPVSLIKYSRALNLDPCKDTCVSIDVLSGKIEPQADPKAPLHLIIACEGPTASEVVSKRLRAIDVISAPGGGIQKVHDLYWDTAPSAGYGLNCRFEGSVLALGGSGAPNCYFALENGQVYGRLQFEVNYLPNQHSMGLRVRVEANPRGTRNLYSTPELTIPLPVMLPYRDPATGR